MSNIVEFKSKDFFTLEYVSMVGPVTTGFGKVIKAIKKGHVAYRLSSAYEAVGYLESDSRQLITVDAYGVVRDWCMTDNDLLAEDWVIVKLF